MSNFWTNISRYPRFFISSSAGLILIILKPFQNLFKTPKFRVFLLFGSFLFIILLYLIIKNMLAL